ncbi:MAG: glutaredoxin family protein [Betaproteobacteria bacterium]
MLKLTVLSRSYCHLCDDMITALENFRGRFSLVMEVVVMDVDAHPELETQWGDRVPVLLLGDREICHYFLDEAKLQECISEIKLQQ